VANTPNRVVRIPDDEWRAAQAAAAAAGESVTAVVRRALADYAAEQHAQAQARAALARRARRR
jgi:hypothetical protein